MRKIHVLLLGLIVLGGVVGCSKEDIGTDSGAVFDANLIDIKNYATAQNLSGTSSNSGLYYVPTKTTMSTVSPTYGQELEFNYRLHVLYGPSNSGTSSSTAVTSKVVDSTYARTSAYFPFFAGSFNAGIEEGVKKMHEGDESIMIMPSILAFGNTATSDGLVPANSPVRYDFRLIRARTEHQQIDDYIARNNLTVTQQSSSGMRFILTKANPGGAVPKTGQVLAINFAGKLLRATTGFAGGTGSDTKTVGTTKFAPGFEEGLALLKIGEKATVVFPSTLGYGASGVIQSNSYVIPPYAPISFDIELVSAQ